MVSTTSIGLTYSYKIMRNKKEKSKVHVTSGAMGGKSTFEKHGSKHFSDLKKKYWRKWRRDKKKLLATVFNDQKNG